MVYGATASVVAVSAALSRLKLSIFRAVAGIDASRSIVAFSPPCMSRAMPSVTSAESTLTLPV